MSASPTSNPSDTPPQVILDYLSAANDGRIDDAAATFTMDSHVHDEDHDHIGLDAIREWITDTTMKHHPQNEILRVTGTNDTFVVTAKVSGNFPGSPVELDFTFVLRNGKISALSIQ